MSKPLDFNMMVFSQRDRLVDLNEKERSQTHLLESASEADREDAFYETVEEGSRPRGQVIEGVSSFISFVSLVLVLYFWNRGYYYEEPTGIHPKRAEIRLTQEVLLYTNKRDMTDPMRMFQTSYNEYCKSAEQRMDIQVPTWDSKNTELSPSTSYGMNISIYASTVSLFWPAVFIYLFSFSFQLTRCYEYCSKKNPQGLYKPWLGPDFSRWLEYLFTSPLQIFIVSTAFGFANRDMVLAQCGMQAALVLLGYNIEQQIKKIYKRHREKHWTFTPRRFHNILWLVKIRDIRGGVYLCLAWSLHYLIWMGIYQKYSLLEDHNTTCEANPDSSMPDVVRWILLSQFICFTTFGLVNSLQFLSAVLHGPKEREDQFGRWAAISQVYGVLSVTSKTLLETFFLWYVTSYRTWPLDRESTVSHSANYSSWVIAYK